MSRLPDELVPEARGFAHTAPVSRRVAFAFLIVACVAALGGASMVGFVIGFGVHHVMRPTTSSHVARIDCTTLPGAMIPTDLADVGCQRGAAVELPASMVCADGRRLFEASTFWGFPGNQSRTYDNAGFPVFVNAYNACTSKESH